MKYRVSEGWEGSARFERLPRAGSQTGIVPRNAEKLNYFNKKSGLTVRTRSRGLA